MTISYYWFYLHQTCMDVAFALYRLECLIKAMNFRTEVMFLELVKVIGAGAYYWL